MKSLLNDMFEYHNHFNQKLIVEIEKNLENLPERTFPLFCHLLNAHHIWNCRILNMSQLYTVNQVHLLAKCLEIDDNNYHETLKILEAENLDREIKYKTSRGEEFTNTIRDILLHVANHSTHHKGQIVADFRSRNIDPIVTDYIFYKREANRTKL